VRARSSTELLPEGSRRMDAPEDWALGVLPATEVFAADMRVEEVRAAIKGRREFKEVVNEHYSVFTYTVPTGRSFPALLEAGDDPTARRLLRVLRECRGLIIASDGSVLSRRYHKFFNVSEHAETRSQNVAALTEDNHVLLEKLDGSMVAPWISPSTGEVVWATKMGVNPVALEAGAFASSCLPAANYEGLVRQCHDEGDE
jgi:hypothetical protein